MCLFDTVGRRNMLIWGGVLQAVFLFTMAALGLQKDPSQSEAQGLVASVMMFNFFFSTSWAPIAYVVSLRKDSHQVEHALLKHQLSRLPLKLGRVRSEKRPWRLVAL